MKKKSILIVDDNMFFRTSIANILSDEYNIYRAENGQQALEILEENSREIFLILLDIIMPVMDGIEFLKRYQKNTMWKFIPVIVFTTDDNEDTETRCLDYGVWDFIPKGVNPVVVKKRVYNAIQKRLEHSSEYDPLTTLYTQKPFFVETRNMLEKNLDKKFEFIRFDIDRFKMINTFYGVQEGDKIIKSVAEIISSSLENILDSTCGRMHADVFVMCIPVEIGTTEFIEKNIISKLNEQKRSYYIQPSMGIYQIEDNSMDVSIMYDRASMASKQCKGSWDKIYAYYDHSMNEKLINEQMVTDKMHQALKNEEFHVFMQPKVNMLNGQVYGAEALIRWIKPNGEIIPPIKFIPVFERNGFIIQTDYYVWKKVCAYLRESLKNDDYVMPIAVNVSRVNIYNPEFYNIITSLVEHYKVPPELLNLEITEGVFIDDDRLATDTITRLKNYGFTILMDDFGSAYSSLNVLKDFPFDIVKIDMKFLSKGNQEKGNVILDSVISMTKKLNLKTIMEGVETKEQVKQVQEMGTDYVQGYYFAKPMPLEDYIEFIAKYKDRPVDETIDFPE